MYLHKGITLFVALDFQGLENGLFGLADMGDIGHGNPLNENRRLQRTDQLTHVDRKTRLPGIPSGGRSAGLFADKGGRRHLAAGHPVDRVVDEKNCHLLAPVGGVEGFRQTDGSQIAVPLVGEDDGVVLGPGNAGADGLGAAVRD